MTTTAKKTTRRVRASRIKAGMVRIDDKGRRDPVNKVIVQEKTKCVRVLTARFNGGTGNGGLHFRGHELLTIEKD